MSSGCVWSERNCACCGPLRSLQTPARRLTGIVEPLLRVATKIAGVRLHELDHNGLGILQSPEPSGAHEDIPQTERESLVQCPQPPLPSHLRVLLKVVEYLKVLADKVLRLRDEAGSVAQRGAGVTMPTTSRAAQRTCNLRGCTRRRERGRAYQPATGCPGSPLAGPGVYCASSSCEAWPGLNFSATKSRSDSSSGPLNTRMRSSRLTIASSVPVGPPASPTDPLSSSRTQAQQRSFFLTFCFFFSRDLESTPPKSTTTGPPGPPLDHMARGSPGGGRWTGLRGGNISRRQLGGGSGPSLQHVLSRGG